MLRSLVTGRALRSTLALTCLVALPVAAGCTDNSPPEPAEDAPLESAEQPLDIASDSAPPVLNANRADLGAKLSTYAGYPGAGKKTPGMIAAVIKGKHIVALGAAGFARLPALQPISEDMLFNIGSNTKSMAATLLSILIEENPTLTWSTNLLDALPWTYVNGKHYIQPSARRAVTLAAVAAHRSGMSCPAQPQPEGYGDDDAWKSKTHQQLLKEHLRGPLIVNNEAPSGLLGTCPGAIGVYNYENQNFAIIQAVIEHWSGMSFIDYARQKLITPNAMGETFLTSQAWFLQMSGSISGTASQKAYWNPYFYQTSHPYLAADKFLWSHDSAGSPNLPADPDENPWGIAPARGGFAFNMVDWARYAILHMRDTSAAIQNTHNQLFPGYNFGWSTGTSTTGDGMDFRALFHDGELDGIQSRINIVPELDLAYLIVANGGPDPWDAINSMFTWLKSQPAYARDGGGCNPAVATGVQRYWDQEMFGCAGAVTYPDRAQLCKTGYHVCSAAEYVSNNDYGGHNAEAPRHNYWTDDNLKFGGSAGSCWAATDSGSSCGASSPMRVCTPEGHDDEGNHCAWESCGLGANSTVNHYFGGCVGDTTAGALCCQD